MITYKVEQNKKFGDYRIDQMVDGKWHNERDDNWTEAKANAILKAINSGTVDFEDCDSFVDKEI